MTWSNPLVDDRDIEFLLYVGDGDLRERNPELPTCLVEQFLDAVYDDPLEETPWTIEGNGDQACP